MMPPREPPRLRAWIQSARRFFSLRRHENEHVPQLVPVSPRSARSPTLGESTATATATAISATVQSTRDAPIVGENTTDAANPTEPARATGRRERILTLQRTPSSNLPIPTTDDDDNNGTVYVDGLYSGELVPPPSYWTRENNRPAPPRTLPANENENSWDIPGEESYPAQNVRSIDPDAVTDSRAQVAAEVGGRLFFLPLFILNFSLYINDLYTRRAPGNLWTLPDINPHIFALVLEALIRGTLSGTEQGINLPLLLEAINLANHLQLSPATNALSLAIPRYIVERCFFYDQHTHALTHGYYLFRSEEIYRAWGVLQRFPRLRAVVEEQDLYLLYGAVVPRGLWEDLTGGFEDQFVAAVRGFGPQDFMGVWAQFQRMTLRTNNAWFPATGINAEDLFGPGTRLG